MTRIDSGAIVVGRPSPDRLAAMLRTAEVSQLSYDHVASTLGPSAGSGPGHRRERRL